MSAENHTASEALAQPLRQPGSGVANVTKHPALLLIAAGGLFVTQGMPLGLAFYAMPVLLRAGGASLEFLALVPLVMLPWVLKFLWAPLVDSRWLTNVGRRRSWIIPLQTCLVLALTAGAFVPIAYGNGMALLVCILVATLISATQDIATDGFAAERLKTPATLATVNVLQIAAFVAGMLIGGPIFLIVFDHFGQAVAFSVLAIVCALSLLPVLMWSEKNDIHMQYEFGAPAKIRNAVSKLGFAFIFVAALLFGGVRAIEQAVIKPMFVDRGFGAAEIGYFTLAGMVALALGAIVVAGPLIVRLGPLRTAILGTLLIAASSQLWLLYIGGHFVPIAAETYVVLAIMLVTGAAAGVVATSASAVMMRWAGSGPQAGTDFTLPQSAHSLSDVGLSMAAIWVASIAGYQGAILLALAVGCLTMTVLLIEDYRRNS